MIGTPVANRARTELEPLVGFFVNMLPLRTAVAGDPTFRELVAAERDTALAAFDAPGPPLRPAGGGAAGCRATPAATRCSRR